MSRVGVYGGVSAEQRRAARRERLLDACATVVGEQGWAHASVRNICSTARLNPRYFYENFSSLDELVASVFDQTVAEAVAEILSALSAAPDAAADQAAALFGTFIHTMTADPRKARLAFTEAMGSEALMQRRLTGLQQLADLLSGMAMRYYAESGLVLRQAALNAHLLVGGLIESVGAIVDGRLDATTGHLATHMTRAFLAINGAPAPVDSPA